MPIRWRFDQHISISAAIRTLPENNANHCRAEFPKLELTLRDGVDVTKANALADALEDEGTTLVSFDRDFQRFPHLQLKLLET
jgi:predicted nucleic acid-binding protein